MNNSINLLNPLGLGRYNKLVLFVLGTFIVCKVLADCSFTGVSGVNFGSYSPLDIAANTNGVGTLSISCHGAGPTRVVSLSTGQSNNFTHRIMSSGTNIIYYNLYSNPVRTQVWGDGTGSSGSVSISSSQLTILNIFGMIPANQNANPDVYTDNIIVTVDF